MRHGLLGVAYASGCNYNKPWEAFGEDELRQAVADSRAATEAALARLDGATPQEQALVKALERRYLSNQVVSEDQFVVWNNDYAAMRGVYALYPNDWE